MSSTAIENTPTAGPLFVHRAGSGEPLVLLHGIGESHVGWRPVLDRLAAEFDVIAIDLPGFGRSPALPGSVAPTAGNLAGAVNDALDRLGVDTYHVAGYSLGARIAIRKTIPVTGGMAGGSADCAAALLALSVLWDLDVTPAELGELGGRLGADVPFALMGQTVFGFPKDVQKRILRDEKPVDGRPGDTLPPADFAAAWAQLAAG